MAEQDIRDVDDLNRFVINQVEDDIKDAEDYSESVIIPTMKERYQIYYADKEYYKRKFPRLSKLPL